jgi:hypothetical protein
MFPTKVVSVDDSHFNISSENFFPFAPFKTSLTKIKLPAVGILQLFTAWQRSSYIDCITGVISSGKIQFPLFYT